MCDISMETKFKSKTVYKVAFQSRNGRLYSPFTYYPLKVGKVKDDWEKMQKMCRKILEGTHQVFIKGSNMYNWHMRGMVSGFGLLSDAVAMVNDDSSVFSHTAMAKKKGRLIILKLTLGGKILKGSTKHICSTVPNNHVAYAGSVIKSIQKLDV
jgi:hypothetical protein